VRADVDADDVLRLVFAVAGGSYRDDAQRERSVGIALDGIHHPVGDRAGRVVG
jgi:hypothetical protein